ncbi:uncharacterized protein N7511_002540 [Penicillium nucicola]|uniref:uncharacterized protein n=1 Tax=Penicillium nucicola TaxID=1850975 RepID=UPI0025457CB8|nr:uncharacterized protein N7511_002540 [Penicillium nucicola]KAJ5770489.1 hypothetical protein N7511_002540 [Penicillium nucicola]
MTDQFSKNDEAQGGMKPVDEDSCMPIAIVGIGFRGPGNARNVEKLEEMIRDGRESWTQIPDKRWNNAAFYHPDHSRHGTINVEGGHFLEEDVSLFDAPFFNMTNDEASVMDPQQRLLLEVIYEGLENAGVPIAQMTGTNTSCFVGSFSADYTDILLRDPECVPMYQCTNAGQSRAMTANRISYFFDLKGPSVTIDTACSGSLVALHLACQSLQTGDASAAIAAGVNLILSHEFMSTMSMMKFLSPDGKCYSFDERANGYARGEAIVCLILKPLASALRDKNTIRAVIRGTGSNQDGRTPGITLPSGAAQESLIRSVYARAGLDPSETEFVEAHGTGTQAGDPIETGAIGRVFGPGRSLDDRLRIGSIKTNVGHLEGASGIAGVIKAVLMLENRIFLPNCNFQTVNSRISLDDWRLKIQLLTEPWESTGPHRVSVNSFGYGGSNAHVILEDAMGYLTSRDLSKKSCMSSATSIDTEEEANRDTSISPSRIFMLSGFDERSCAQQMQVLRSYILDRGARLDNEKLLDNLAFTLNERRSNLTWKVAVVANTIEDLATSLAQNIKAKSGLRRPRVGFIFTGQGAQWVGMGQELLQAYPVFRNSVLAIDSWLEVIGAPFLVEAELKKCPQDSDLNHPRLSQTICTALQIALVNLLYSWDIYPDSVAGHSSGEIAAAYAVGALSVEDAMSVAYYRGVVASQVLDDYKTRGAMIAVGLSAEDVQKYIDRLPCGHLVVACINSPSSVTVSGDNLAIAALAQLLKNKPVFTRQLVVDVAYHSPHMALVADEYRRFIEYIEPQSQDHLQDERGKRSISFFSSVTGEMLSQEVLDTNYWVSNLIGQVKFADSVRNLCFETNTQRSGNTETVRSRRVGTAQKANIDCLVEIGPHAALSGPIKQILRADPKLNSADIVYASVLKRKENAVTAALGMAATLASLNYPVNFGAINRPQGSEETCVPQLLVDLPPYTWNHARSYWAEPRLSKMFRNRSLPRNDILGVPDNMHCPCEPRWRNFLRTSELPWLLDHKIQGSIVFPAAGYLAIAIEASMQLVKSEDNIARYVLRDVSIKSALVLNETSAVEIMVSIRESIHKPHELYEFHIYSISGDNRWTEHCTGLVGSQRRIGVSVDEPRETDNYAMVPLGTEVHGISVIDTQDFYQKLHQIGLEYGPCFANLSTAHVTQEGACFAEVTVPDTRSAMPCAFQHDLLIHPCTLDSIFHAVFAALTHGMDIQDGPAIPISIEEMIVSSGVSSSAGNIMSICTHVRQGPRKDVMASIVVVDCNDKHSEMEPSISIRGLRCTRLERERGHLVAQESQRTYRIEWKADSYFLSNENATFLFEQEDQPTQELICQAELEKCAVGFIKTALDEVTAMEARKLHTSHRRFRCHLQDVLDRYEEEHHDLKAEFQDLQSSSTESLLRSIGENLVPIIRAQMDFTDVIKDHHLLDTFWDIFSTDSSYKATSRYLDLIGHKKPDISILEFGVGTGQVSKLFLEQLAHSAQIPHLGKYTFAHESRIVLEHAMKRLEPWSDLVDCKLLDPREDLATQGLEEGSFDIVILPHGLCTSQCEQNALCKIYDLLKPLGSLIAISPFHPKQNIVKNLLFSALHCLSAEEFCLGQGGWPEWQWDETLREAQFTAVNVFTDKNCEENHQFIVARKEKFDKSTAKVSIICDGESGIAVADLVLQLERLACEVDVRSIEDVETEGRICLVLDSQKETLLAAPDGTTLDKIKATFMHSAGILWVTRGGTIESVNPNANLAVGFARTARAESGVNLIITLDLDAQNPLSESHSAELLAQFFATRFLRGGANDDTEFAERNGTVLIPRVLEDSYTSTAVVNLRDTETVSEQYFHLKKRPLRLSRGLEDPRFVEDCALMELPAGYVGIRVHAFGLSEQDLWRDTHDCNTDDMFGLECSGVVYNVGAGVCGISIGDRVACLGTGTARSFYHDRAAAFQRISDQMSFELASALPVAYSTAYYIDKYYLWCLQSNEVILVHRAGCWCGQAILELLKMKGNEIFVTVQDSTEAFLLSCRFRIPTKNIFIDGQDDILKSLTRLTHGEKAKVVISLGTDDDQIQSCTAPFGHFIRIANDRSRTQRVSRSQNISLSSFNMFDFQKERRNLANHIWSEVFRLFQEGRLKGLPGTAVYNVSQIRQAVEEASIKRHIVVSAASDDLVMATLPKPSEPLFSATASYLLVGGLGGIGREVALWMVQNGAKSLVLLNRSGLSKEKSQTTVRELEEKGVQVMVQVCNIFNEIEVQQMIVDVSHCAPPIRGVIQGAMVVKDIHIENMSLDDYREVMGPKCAGTWNLHRHLPKDLDFFLMLSSISGVIGNATQAAYAAGCSFQDSFAAYRRGLGLSAVSLDLGTITDVGYLAENRELSKKMEKQGFEGTDTQTLLSLIQVAISQPPCRETQIVTGLGQWKEERSLGNFSTPLFSHFRRKFQTHGKATMLSDWGDSFKVELQAARTVEQATLVICEAMRRKIALHLAVPVENIDLSHPVSEYGVDSHVAVELRNWVSRVMECTVSILQIIASSILDLSSDIASQKLDDNKD